MKTIIYLLILAPVLTFSQQTETDFLKFNKKYYECEDKWVVFPQLKGDTTYTFGFIYLNEEAGFTFNFEGKFYIDSIGNFVKMEVDSIPNFKIRLTPKTNMVSVIPNFKLLQLKLQSQPDWLHYYKKAERTIKSKVRKGFHYNHKEPIFSTF